MKIKIFRILILFIVTGIFFLLPSLVSAENGSGGDSPEAKPIIPTVLIKPGRLPGPPQPKIGESGITGGEFEGYVTQFAKRYFPNFLGFIAIAAVFVLIVGGIMFLTAFGNEERLTQAKKIVQWAIIGLVLSMLAYAIVKVILELPFGGTATTQQTPGPQP